MNHFRCGECRFKKDVGNEITLIFLYRELDEDVYCTTLAQLLLLLLSVVSICDVYATRCMAV